MRRSFSEGMRDDRLQVLAQLASRIGISIGRPVLYDQALTHASAASDALGSNGHYEALEFVGDAVLELAVTDYLYKRVPGRAPGEYTKMRARSVNRHALARVAERLDIAPAIRLGRGEEQSGGRKRKALLADCMEALIGAIYLDQGWEVARDTVIRAFGEELEVAEAGPDGGWDYRSRLQDYCQGKRLHLPKFAVIRAEGPDHRKVFEVEVSLEGAPMGRGEGRTKKEAERNAAKAALEQLGQSLG